MLSIISSVIVRLFRSFDLRLSDIIKGSSSIYRMRGQMPLRSFFMRARLPRTFSSFWIVFSRLRRSRYSFRVSVARLGENIKSWEFFSSTLIFGSNYLSKCVYSLAAIPVISFIYSISVIYFWSEVSLEVILSSGESKTEGKVDWVVLVWVTALIVGMA